MSRFPDYDGRQRGCASQFRPDTRFAHHAWCDDGSHAGGLDRRHEVLVDRIDHQGCRNVAVEPRHADRRRLVAEFQQHLVGRTLQGNAAHDWRDCHHRVRGGRRAGRSTPASARIGPIDTSGFDGAITHDLAVDKRRSSAVRQRRAAVRQRSARQRRQRCADAARSTPGTEPRCASSRSVTIVETTSSLIGSNSCPSPHAAAISAVTSSATPPRRAALCGRDVWPGLCRRG